MKSLLDVFLFHQQDEMTLTTKGNESYDVLTELLGKAGPNRSKQEPLPQGYNEDRTYQSTGQ